MIQQMRDATGARIKVEPEVAGCSERLISFSSLEEAGLDWCRAQEALFLVQSRLSEGDSAQEDSCCMVSNSPLKDIHPVLQTSLLSVS